MGSLGILKLIWILGALLHGYSAADVQPNRVTVQSGEGFLIRLNLNGFAPLQNCQLARNNKSYFFPPGQNKTHSLVGGEVAYPFNSNNVYECGVRVLNCGSKCSGTWRLTSVDENGTENSGTMEVTVIEKKTECPSANCTKYNLDAMSDTASCAIKSEWKNYACNFWSDGKMTDSTIEFPTKFPLPELAKMVDSDSHTIFECVYDKEGKAPMKLTECFIENVSSGQKYFIKDGLQDIRYSAYLTNFEEGICQFEIPHGAVGDEVGIWKMTVKATNKEYSEYDNYYGNRRYYENYITKWKTCKFQMRGNTTVAKEELVQRTKAKIVIKTIQPLVTIECAKKVFYPIYLCYLMAPAGPLLSDDKEKFEDGNCEFKVAPGNWTCGFNGPTKEDADFMQDFEVIQYPTEVIDEKMNSIENGSISLECHLINKWPIQLCMFVSPTGKVYRPPTDNFQSNEFSFYTGGKMSTGDCGIQFNADFQVENGSWTCVIAKTNGQRLRTKIHVVY